MEFFSASKNIGIFRGFREGGLEFHADLALPYDSEFQRIPMHGQMVLVQLETPDEAVVGRITRLSSEGQLTGSSGENFNIRAMRETRAIPEQLREDYLKYRVDIRVLGVLRAGTKNIQFVASHRRLPHVGSPVAFLDPEVLKQLLGSDGEGALLGHYALGEYVYEGQDAIESFDWIQYRNPKIQIKFDVRSLVARRSLVFARAGFGKSNLNKLLFSALYKGKPVVEKRGGKKVPVGTLIFDPDGEYFWPDDKDRPGLADVGHLRDQLVVFTSRAAPSEFYKSFVATGIRLDIRQLSAADVITLALSPEKQDQQNVAKLRGVRGPNWSKLVDLIAENGNAADTNEVKELIGARDMSEVEVFAARANMTRIVSMLHDPASRLMDALIASLRDGKLCVVDVSQLRGGPSLVLSGLILRRIFDRNQEEFTKENPDSIPTIAVVEEAQSVLNEKASASQPYIEWVKEGRKYDLGALLITQQPGSIPAEILSQGDNWFIFHLLSAADLRAVKQANAHYSDDLLSSLLNEPIPGHGIYWSSAEERPFPISFRTLLFENIYTTQDPHYNSSSIETYASQLRERLRIEVMEMGRTADSLDEGSGREQEEDRTETESLEEDVDSGDQVDFRSQAIRYTIAQLAQDNDFWEQLERPIGIPWFVVQGKLLEALPASMDQKDDLAHQLVPQALNEILGEQDIAWEATRKSKKNKPDETLLWIVRKNSG